MRPTGHANVDATSPRAFATCDKCGMWYNHYKLRWRTDWRGPKLQNLRVLVCPSCYDKYQPNGQRTIILPPDPVPIMNARPELFVADDNPLSGIGTDANPLTPLLGSVIGTLTGGGGLNSAFDSNTNKPGWMSANNTISDSSYGGYVGINWNGNTTYLNMPSSRLPPVLTHSVTSFTAYAPNDRSFLGTTPTAYVLQGSVADSSLWAAWTTVASGVTTGTVGETITGTGTTGGRYQFFRLAFQGDGVNSIAVAQLQLNVGETGEITVSST